MIQKNDQTELTLWYCIRHPLVSLAIKLDETVFKSRSEEEIIAEQMRAATREAEQAAKVIRDHLFTQHMARSRIKALEDWNANRNLLCDHANNQSLL